MMCVRARVVTREGMDWCLFGLDTTWPSYEIQDKGCWVVAPSLPSS